MSRLSLQLCYVGRSKKTIESSVLLESVFGQRSCVKTGGLIRSAEIFSSPENMQKAIEEYLPILKQLQKDES